MSDYPALGVSLGNLETQLFRQKFVNTKISNPVYVMGLARSGTTILLDLLNQTGAFSSWQYRDHPFVMAPMLWHTATKWMVSKATKVERAHKDRIMVTPDSPEAFEELIWRAFFPTEHNGQNSTVINETKNNEDFELFYSNSIKKLISLKTGQIYLAKGNYNVGRIAYINKIYPQAKFLIMVRHPLHQIQSLISQHKLFLEYTKLDNRVPRYLASAGHFEFGPQRRPSLLNLNNAARIREFWRIGEEAMGYALCWQDVYGYLLKILGENKDIEKNTMLMKYEDFCNAPIKMLQDVVEFLGIKLSSKNCRC